MDTVYGLIALTILIMLSGAFSGVEAAFLSLSNLRVRRLVKKRVKNSGTVKELKDDAHKLIITLLIGNNLVNIAASAIAAALAIDRWGSAGVGIATGAMTFFILIFGEIVPKSQAIQHAERICLITARPLKALKFFLYPFVVSFDFINRMMGSAKINKPLITEEELKSFVEIGEETGSIEADEKEMIHNIFKLNDIEVREVMTPKIRMSALDGSKTLGESMDMIIGSPHSRIPLFMRNRDKIIGILHIKDTIKHIRNDNFGILLKDIGQEPLIVPETKLADDLLHEMQRQHKHIAIVVDEYGLVAGLVTIEDILEEIVGEIYDENDVVEPMVKMIDKKSARVRGETSIEDFNRKMKLHLTQTNGYDTIGGYILKEIGRIPSQGESVALPEFEATVEKVQDNRIAMVRIVKK